MTPSRCSISFTVAVLALTVGEARAQDERLRLMAEPTGYADVIDAFDEDDPFDVNVTLGFERSRQSGRIRRELNDPRASGGRDSHNFADLADYEHQRNVLQLGVEAGIWRDLALRLRLPVVLSDSRTLRATSQIPAADVNRSLCTHDPGPDAPASTCTTVDGAPGNELYTIPFDSPTRSGIDYLSLGLAWGIMNQHRDPHLPTWLVMIEGRFSLGEPMHACRSADGGTTCIDGEEPGVSRDVNALRLETRASRRYRHVEPYAGLAFQIEWPKSGNQYTPSGNLVGYQNTLPPRTGEVTAGMTVVPWENRQAWQRFAVDLRLTARYESEGHDYGPLFDALGTSDSRFLTEANLEGIPDGSTQLREVEFFGLTDTQARARLGGRIALEMWAAKYVRFSFGTGFYYTTAHMITFADACNPGVTPTGDTDARMGRCRSGIINPHHRPAIDLPGRRFQLDDSITVDFFASLTGQF